MSMNDYAASLEYIAEREDASDEKLTRDEMRVLRKYVGELSWLSANIIPDLLIYALDLAKKQKQAVLKDFQSVNRVLKVRERESKVVFWKIGKKEELCVLGISDASYH